MGLPLRLLMVEDSDSDAQLIVRRLEQAGYEVVAERVESAAQLRTALIHRVWDLIISDYQLPQFDGLAALHLLQGTGQDMPFIIVSGAIGETRAVALMKAGAHDYVMKDNLARLVPVVERELAQTAIRREHRQAEAALRDSEARYRAVVEDLPVLVCRFLSDGTLTFVNDAYCRYFGKSRAELTGHSFAPLIPPADQAYVLEQFGALSPAQPTVAYEHRVIAPDGTLRWQRWIDRAVFDGEQLIEFQSIGEDITERKRTEAALRESEERYRQLFDSSLDAILLTAPDGSVFAANPAACRMFERTADEIRQSGRGGLVDVTDPRVAAALAERQRTGHFSGELTLLRRDGTPFPGEVTTSLFNDPQGQPRTSMIIRDITERKQVEAALRRSEETLQSTLDGLSAHIANLDAQGRIIVINAAWKQFAVLNGLTADGYGLGQNYLDVCDRAGGDGAGEAAVMATGIRDVLAGRRDNFYLEYPCHSPAEQRWFAVRVTPFVGAGPARAVVAHDNITVRVLAEQDLRRSAQRLENTHDIAQAILQAQSSQAIAEVALSRIDRLIPGQRASIMLFEAATDQALVLAAVNHPDPPLTPGDRLPWSETYHARQADLQRGLPVMVYDLPAHAQEARIVQTLAAYGLRRLIAMPLLAHGQLIGVLNLASRSTEVYKREQLDIIQEVADQLALAIRQAQLYEQVQRHAVELEQRVLERTAELAHERERLRAILDAAGDGMVFTNVTGDIEYINPAMERLTGYLATEALGHNPHIWQSGQTPRAVYERMWGAITGGETWRGELINRRHDGSLYDAALTVAPLQDAERRVFGFVGALRDITHQKELDRLKDQFVANVSHELRTPLTSIMLNLDLLDRGKPEKHAYYLATLRREAERLKIMIEDLLDLSRLDRQTAPLELGPLDLGELVERLVTDRVTVATERGLGLEFLSTLEAARVMAETSILTQVISNLITNALNYTPAGGSVTVQTHRQRVAAQDWLTLTVRDTGPGISARDLPHVFERFYRGEVGRKAKAPGTGLGLAISKAIMEQLGGRITVESEPGQGTAFTVWLRPV